MLSVFFTVLRAYKALDNLFLRLVIWCLKLRFGSKKTPKNLTAGMSSLVVTLQIGLMFSLRVCPGLLLSHRITKSWVMEDLEKIINFVLSG